MTAPHQRVPDLTIGGLQVWIHGRQFPDAHDHSDGNWLVVTAECRYPQSFTRVEGPIVHMSEVVELLRGVQALYRDLRGVAMLACMEPYLHAELTVADGLGHISLVLSVTPDHLAEEHTFRSELDQSYLPGIIADCQSILERYPVRGVSG